MSFAFFSEGQARFFGAFLEVVVPEAHTDIVRAADRMISSKPASIQRKMKLFMFVASVLPVFRFFRTFPNLSVDARERFLGWMASGPIGLFRLGFWGLRSVALLAFYGDERSWEGLEYSGPILDRPRRLDLPVDPFDPAGHS